MEPATSAAAISLVSMSWERIQLHVELRLPSGTDLDPDRLRLSRVDRHGVPAPVRATREGDRIRLRINVMQGPDLQPLAEGDWRLVSTPATAERPATGRAPGPRPGPRPDSDRGRGPIVPVVVDGSSWPVAPERSAAAFPIRTGTYHAKPSLSADGWFHLVISFNPGVGLTRDAPQRGVARRWVTRGLRAVRLGVFRTVMRGLQPVRQRSGRRILFSSDSRAGLEGNLKDVHDRMVARGLDRDYRLDSLFRASVGERRGVLDRLRMPWLLAAADVIVIDDFQPVIYQLEIDPQVRIVQLWHASGAFKTVGYSRVGKPGGPDPYSRVHKNYTAAIVSSTHDVPFYAEAFGIPDERVIPTGIPRMDRYFDDGARAAGLAAAHAAFPTIAGRRVWLFAPTFRGDGPRTAAYDLDRIDYAALHALAAEQDAAVIIKMHPFVRAPLGIPAALADRLIDGSAASIDVNDLLFAVDLLITDYSSIVFEFSTLGRPMLFFAYDLDDYIATRDFYVPFEAFVPGRIVRTFADLLDAIRRKDFEQDKVAAFAARHFDHLDGQSTDRVIDELIIPR